MENKDLVADATAFEGKCVLITGGAGSIGSKIVKALLSYNVLTVRVFDVDECSLAKLARELKDVRVETLLGDIKDVNDVEMAIENMDIIIHGCAVKMVDVSSFHPIPCIRTNVDGTINLIRAVLKGHVEKCLFLSSDKAVDYASVYGSTKFLGERLFLWANSVSDTRFSCVRMGNVVESRGNVFAIWREQKAKGEPITITHLDMQRYFWHVKEAVAFILNSIEKMGGGEIFIPKMELFKILELAQKRGVKIRQVGTRPEEIITPKLYSDMEKDLLEDCGDFWVLRT